MASSRWQRQHIHFRQMIWGVSAVVSMLLFTALLALGFGLEVAGVFFIIVFVALRISLAFAFNNRYANAMVRVLRVDYEAIERDFRLLFKERSIRYYRKSEDDAYAYEFPGRSLSMRVQAHWLSQDMVKQPVTKVTLSVVSEKNRAFAEMLADAIDEMAVRLVQDGAKG